jgi:hypothetical protein
VTFPDWLNLRRTCNNVELCLKYSTDVLNEQDLFVLQVFSRFARPCPGNGFCLVVSRNELGTCNCSSGHFTRASWIVLAPYLTCIYHSIVRLLSSRNILHVLAHLFTAHRRVAISFAELHGTLVHNMVDAAKCDRPSVESSHLAAFGGTAPGAHGRFPKPNVIIRQLVSLI